ncbi:hypothetical protein QBC33DRAFT_577788 [Phialemonium atrogriseum]|uniref:Uncharacterized protein n=1 Tax=Phialemonium atrogriseum TaxID=1093897 RepID=A0AAJ0C2Y2_9PEZI|nr:uncharacterized protein QBC33DRAFT_577788 [Phialemonium atrogriseum]KAK1768138.1 hypothetical protein QBC33DRAFT_577788 [Phialemonium atrogriseum]
MASGCPDRVNISYSGPEADLIHSRSASQWQAALGAAESIQGVLSRTPSLPENIPSDANSIEGYSTWRNTDASCCLAKTERVFRFALRKRWAYILSSSLAERQNLSIAYNPVLDSPSSLEIDLDYALPQELAWKAIASCGVGWTIADGQVSPWAVRVEDIGLCILARGADGYQRPPTAREAACYLARLYHAYDLGSQCSVVLAAALTLPLHASTAPLKSASIELPRPSFPARVTSPGQLDYQDFPAEFSHLGYYMSLSLCPWIFGPITSILNPIISNDNLELLAKILSFTVVAPLWLSSILPSLAKLQDCPHAQPAVDSAAWTSMPQSFINLHPPGPYLRDGMVSRSDVWRLRHDCNREYEDNTFAYSPAYGWPPFDKMRAEDVELEIRNHLQCSHRWEYAWWTWLPDKTDAGFSTNCLTALPSKDVVADGHQL